MQSRISSERAAVIGDGKNGAAGNDLSFHQTRVESDTLETVLFTEQVAYMSDVTSIRYATESVNELGNMSHAETSVLDVQLTTHTKKIFVCKHCKRSAETLSLSSSSNTNGWFPALRSRFLW